MHKSIKKIRPLAYISKKSEEDMLETVVDIIIWFVFKLVKIVYLYPLNVINSFKKRKKCNKIDDPLLQIPAARIVEKICTRELKCVDLIKAYILRINQVNPILNAMVENCFQSALNKAAEVDTLVASGEHKPAELMEKYPLLGVPLSVKESIAVEGCSYSGGLKSLKDRKALRDAECVNRAKSAGAIPLLLTNTPELCLHWESINKVTGVTNNPYDTRRTAGGSSGGEAAILSTGGSLIGLGSDIAGSLRLPSHYCGVYGHKPTPGIISIDGHFPSSSDDENWALYFSIGPMARYASDLNLLFDVLVKPEFRDIVQSRSQCTPDKIKLYYMETNGVLLANKVDNEIISGMKKVLRHFKTKFDTSANKINLKLFRRSHSLYMIPLLSIKGVENIFYGRNEKSLIKEKLKYHLGISDHIMNSIDYIILNKFVDTCLPKTFVDNLRAKNVALREELEEILGDNGVLIMPTFTQSAPYHFTTIPQLFDSSYLGIFNSLGLPVTNCPIGFNSNGLPFGIQIISKRYCDKLCMTIAQEIEDSISNKIIT